MENSSEKCGGVEIGVGIPKRKRSVDLKIFDKSRAYEVGGSEKKVMEENGERNVKKKKRKSGKEVCLSGYVSDAKKSKKEDVNGGKSEVDYRQIVSDWTKGLHGISFALSDADNLFIFPKRPRGSVGRVKLETDQDSAPLGISKSADHAGAFNAKVIKIEDGTGDEVASNSKSAGKVGGSSPKLKAKALAKSMRKVGDSNSKLKLNAGSKSMGKAGGSNSKSKQKADVKSTGKVDGPDLKSKQSADLNSAGEVSGLESKLKQKVDSKSTGKVSGSNTKSKKKAVLKSGEELSGSGPKLKEKAGLKSTGKVGGSDSKLKQSVDLILTEEVDCSNSKLKQKADLNSAAEISSLDSKSKQKADLKSAGKVGGLVSKVKQKANLKKNTDSKSTEEVNGANSKSKQKLDSNQKADLVTPEDIGGSSSNLKQKLDFLHMKSPDLESTEEVSGSNSKSKRKWNFDLNRVPDLKSIEKVSGSDVNPKQKGKLKSTGGTSDPGSELNQATDLKSVSKVGGSNSKSKKNTDSKSTCKGSHSGIKLKRKAEFKESRNGKEDNLVVNNEDTSSKKRRSNNKRKKDLVVDRDVGEASKIFEPLVVVDGIGEEALKKSDPSVGSSVPDSILIDLLSNEDDDDEENLEQNAARMLSSRFDPSCTGFLSQRKSSLSQMSNGFSFPVTYSREATSSSGVDPAPADDSELKPTTEDKGKGVTRKRRYYYDILPENMDAFWFLNKRIKVFWPSDQSWHYGLVNEYHPECMVHQIKYDDQKKEWVVLKEEKFKISLFPSEVPEKLKSRKRSGKVKRLKTVIKEETVLLADDDRCMGIDLDSEPIALWLARSSGRVKSVTKPLKLQRISDVQPSDVPSLSSEKNGIINSSVSDSTRPRSNPDQESASTNNLNGCVDGITLVYVRRKNLKKGEAASWNVSPLAPVTAIAKEDKFQYGFLDSDKQFWSIDDNGRLRLDVVSVESRGFRFQICLPLLPFKEVSFGRGNFRLLHNMLMLQQGLMVTISPAVTLQMLFVDSYEGIRFLLFEGCMKQALAFVFSILNAFTQPGEQWNGDMHVPVTSIRFRLSSVEDVRKYHVFEFHSFSPVLSTKRLDADCKLLKQLPVSECTYNNIKEISSYVGFEKIFMRGILPMGISREACNTRNIQSTLSTTATPGKVPQFVISFFGAPTSFLTPHLQSLMENSFARVNPQRPSALSSPENCNGSALQFTQFNSSVVAASDIVDKDDSSSALKKFQNITVEIPSSDHDDMSFDGKRLISRQVSSSVSWNANEDFFSSPKSTGRRSSLRRGRSSSISSPLKNLSPVWPDGPKRPRTHVQYTLPSAGYEFNGKQKTQNQKSVPCKRIRQASLKRSNEKNIELLTCSANVLITHEDKGWRECGVDILLEAADHNEWKLVVKISGVTRYSYKVKHILQAGTTNRYSHCMMWKGGKDWALEFTDRSQWMLFKEMHGECYNRNVRAASVKHIPIPGVKLVEESHDCGIDGPFVRNSIKYFRQVQTDAEMAIDPSRVLYDMDSDDEEWLMTNRNCERVGISDELLEKIIDMFEKASYVQRRDSFSDYEIQELVMGVGIVEAAKIIYEYWREKRGKMCVPLIRHLQPPLWERYQQQLKEWERTVGRGNSVGNHEKFPPEKPPMFAFCLKPRGLEVFDKVSKQRSHRKFSVNGHHNSHLGFGRRSNRRAIIDEKVLYTNTVHESSDLSPSLQALTSSFPPQDADFTMGKPVFYRNKSRKLSSIPNGVQMGLTELSNQFSHDGLNMQGAMKLNNLDLQAREASRAAQRARHIAKLKREKAEKMACKADVAIQKAATALMTANAIKAANDSSNCNKNDSDDLSRP